MKNLKINWLNCCEVCSSKEHLVSTEKGSENWLYDGDKVECLSCGAEGEIDTDGDNAWVNWDEFELTIEKYAELKILHKNAVACLMESNFNDEDYLRKRGAIK